MVDERVKRFAKLLVDYSMEIKKGDVVRINGTPECKDLFLNVYEEAVKKGAHVDPRLSFDEQSYIFLNHAEKDQLERLTDLDMDVVKSTDCWMSIMGGTNLYSAPGTEEAAEKQMAIRKSKQPIQEEVMGNKRWNVTLFPTYSGAQEAKMPIQDFEDFVYSAVFADKEDPVAEWKKLSKQQQTLTDMITNGKKVRIVGKETDLKMSIEGMKAINCDGKFNMPDGEVFTGPVLNSVNGKILYDIPSVIGGQEVKNIRLEFKDGKVVDAKSDSGQEMLDKQLNTDEGARYVGELGLGNNFGITYPIKQILFDEKIGGTVHLAVGVSYPETGCLNKSAIHWDMIKDLREEGEFYLDDKLIQKNGVWIFE